MKNDDEVDLYDSHYGSMAVDVQRQVRLQTYGEELGQTSWVTAGELRELMTWLDLTLDSELLEVACGSGGASMLIARETGASVTGIDSNPRAIEAAEDRLAGADQHLRVRFLRADASQPLPFPDGSFDAIYCNDSINHLLDRAAVLSEWYRVLRPGGLALYADPVVVTGVLTGDEMRIRSSIGAFLFVPLGENERFLQRAGFELVRTEDRTQATASVSRRWYEAREQHRAALIELEGEQGFAGVQRFLDVVHRLSSEGRLSRHVYLARKPRH